MVDVHRYHQISEASHHILNPLSPYQLMLLGEMCELHPGQHQLDLASGKGEMLCQYAQRFGMRGTGIDLFAPYIDASTARAAELGVGRLVQFIHSDASTYELAAGSFEIVSCIGATWIGGGLAGTLELMRRSLRGRGWLLVGEAYWIEDPTSDVREELEVGDEFSDLGGTLAVFEYAGMDLVEMVLATHETWDRYAASQWLNVAKWLDKNPDHRDAEEVRAIRDRSRRAYLRFGRRYLGWGVFVLRPAQD